MLTLCQCVTFTHLSAGGASFLPLMPVCSLAEGRCGIYQSGAPMVPSSKVSHFFGATVAIFQSSCPLLQPGLEGGWGATQQT